MKDIAKFLVYGGLFLIPFLALYVENGFFFPYITGKNFGFRIIVEIVFAAWVLLALYEPKYRPKSSLISWSFIVFLVVMFFANLFGESRLMSFWSNFERMDGYLAILHTFMYFIVMASVLTTDKLWNRFFATTLVAAGILSIYAFGQKGGFIEHRYGGFRVDATLGNATYMAIYMLFHTAIAALMVVRTESKKMRYVYIFLVALFAYLLVQTATRGTTLGLVGAVLVSMTYVAVYARQYPIVRKAAIGVLLGLVVIVGTFVAVRKTEFVQNSQTLTRIANVSLSEGNVRFKVWKMAYEGFKERPLLGWGQSNFNYVFNEHYDPSIYFAESWYDRVHNILFDWLIAGGIFGALAYFAIYFSTLYYLFVRPMVQHEEVFSVAERGILIGLLAGYLFHNLFVFDNIVSYIYYGVILAFIHARIGMSSKKLADVKIDQRVIEQVATPVIGVALLVTLYFMNIPGIQAAGDIINAFKATTPDTMLAEFNTALNRHSFGDQEIREQMTRRAQEMAQAQGITSEQKQLLNTRVEEELLKQIAEKPGDARAHVFIASFYRTLGTPESLDKAVAQLVIARSLSPQKQQIIFEQGLAQLQKQQFDAALAFFKEAYDLDTSYSEARVYYAMAAFYAGKSEIFNELIVSDADKDAFAQNDLAVQAVYSQKNYPILLDMFERRIRLNPTEPQLRTSYAYLLNESGDTAKAIEVLKKAAEDIPTFKDQAEKFMQQLVSQNLGIQPKK